MKANPFRYFKTSPEVIRLVVMMYIRFPLSRNFVETQLQIVGAFLEKLQLGVFKE